MAENADTHKQVEQDDIVAIVKEHKQLIKENKVLKEAAKILIQRKNENPASDLIRWNKNVDILITVEFRSTS